MLEKIDYSYKASEVVRYIKLAYGGTVEASRVNLTLGNVHLALEELGYKDDDHWFYKDPRIEASWAYNSGDIVCNTEGGVAVVSEVRDDGSFSVRSVPGWKSMGKTAWFPPKEVSLVAKRPEITLV